MDHSTFVEKYRTNKLEVSVDKNKAGFMYQDPGLLPQKLRKRQALIRTVGFSAVPLGIILFFFVPWWSALIVLFIGLAMFPYAQYSAAQGVLDVALKDKHVYQTALDNQVLTIKEVVESGK